MRSLLIGGYVFGSGLLLSFFPLAATELAPWYLKVYQIRPHAAYRFQTYRGIATQKKSSDCRLHGNFVDLSVLAVYEPWQNPYSRWCGELELLLADTTHRAFGFDSMNLTVRYQLLDDVGNEDPVSAVAGITLIKANKKSLYDLSSFHHGQFEGEIHFSVGKEWDYNQFWASRIWAVGALGLADHGSPWVRCSVHWAKNYYDRYQIEGFVKTLWGLGGKGLTCTSKFSGYGPINHRSIDIGIKATCFFDFNIEASFLIACRAYAHSFPTDGYYCGLSFIYPFGI